MRKGILFVGLTGLCGFVLMCLIAWAEEKPASLAPPAQSEPADISPGITRYSRHRESAAAEENYLAENLPASPASPLGMTSASSPSEFTPLPPLSEAEDFSIPAGFQMPEAPVKNDPFSAVDVAAPPANDPPPAGSTSPLFPADPPQAPQTAGGRVTILNVEPVASNPSSPENVVADPIENPVAATSSSEAPADFQIPSTTGPQTATVTLEWIKRTEINVGQECQCDLVVKNTGGIPAQDVTVEAAFPASARLLPTITPAPQPVGDRLRWSLGEIAPSQSKLIEVHMVPTGRGDLKASAVVHFTSAAATAFRVQEPLLEVVLKGPKEVQVGDPASQIIQVSNPGTGTARNVEIRALIPEGLEHPQGKQLSMSIGSLNPGETRMVRLALAAAAGGTHHVKVLAEAKLTPESAPYLRKLTETQIRIISPSVKMEVQGPGLRYKNRSATYKLTVTNDGTTVSNNVRVLHKVPEGFRFLSATEGGKFDALSKTASWFVGRIEPGQSAQMEVTLEAVNLGEYEHIVSAITDQGTRSEDRVLTKIDGIAALTLEIKDFNDPVEVGTETAYEIRVKNQGTKEAQNVRVACELPEGVELVDVKAPAVHNLEGRVLIFQSLPALDAEKAAVYRIIVKGKTAGYHRFRARLASDSIQEPLLVEELTNFYGE